MHFNIFVTETVYSGCALAFILLIALMIMHGRTSTAGLAILACCLASLAWSGANAVSGDLYVAIPTILDAIRLSAWLLFAVVMVTIRAGDGSGLGRAYLFCALARLLPLRHRQRCVGAVPQPLRGGPRHDPTITPYRLRGWGAPDNREPMA